MTRASITSDAEPDQQITIYTADPTNNRAPGQILGCLRSADVDQVVGASLTVVHTVIGFS